jgi:hypothetical protein
MCCLLYLLVEIVACCMAEQEGGAGAALTRPLCPLLPAAAAAAAAAVLAVWYDPVHQPRTASPGIRCLQHLLDGRQLLLMTVLLIQEDIERLAARVTSSAFLASTQLQFLRGMAGLLLGLLLPLPHDTQLLLLSYHCQLWPAAVPLLLQAAPCAWPVAMTSCASCAFGVDCAAGARRLPVPCPAVNHSHGTKLWQGQL